MYDNVTIFVNSCDSRSDAWEPFFKLLSDYWPNHPEKIVLNSETKQYTCEYMQIKTITHEKMPWGKRFREALEKVDTEFIVYFLEDFFLMSPVSDKAFQIALDKIQNDKSIGCISLKYNQVLKYREGKEHSKDQFVSKDDLDTLNRVNNMSVLWRKDWLLKLICDTETPWEFDRYASIRSRKYPYQVMMINCAEGGMETVFDYGVDFEYGYGIYKGKWLPKNKELFEAHGIEVDFDRIGWYSPTENIVGGGERSALNRMISLAYQVKKRIRHTIKKIVSSI